MPEQPDRTTKVAILADSVAQVPADIVRQLDMTIIPFIVNIDGQPYYDGAGLVLSELYRRMRLEKIMPTTSAPPPAAYQQAFRTRLQAGAQALVCITLSGKLSSGYNNACLAAQQVRDEYRDRVIEILDSKQATLAEGFIAIAAARAAQEGQPVEGVLQVAQAAARHVGLAAALDTLEYVARGGRIGKVAYLAGSLVKIRPVVRINEQGLLSPLNNVRTENRAMQVMLDYVASQKGSGRRLYLAILEADALEQAAKLKALALKILEPYQVFDAELTPVMGAHAGPGVIGLSYYYEP
jgi:DegV family protein with EDD domain